MEAFKLKIPILYEDNHLLIVEKPINIPVQKDDSKDDDLLSILKDDLKIRYKKPGNVYLGLVHRLDRPVGGAILFAKTSKAASRLANQMRKLEIDRTYLAVTRGTIKESNRQLKHYLLKDRSKNKVFSVNKDTKGAKKASLKYEVIERKNNLTLVQVKLETGRSHQIRVQLKEAGYPLYGDQKYGENVNKKGQQIALWSYQLSFIHPVKKELTEIKSIPPKETYPWSVWEK